MVSEVRIPFTRVRIGRFLFLLISIVLLFVLRPFLEDFVAITYLAHIFVTVILLSAVYAVSQKMSIFITALLIVLPAVVLEWASELMGVSWCAVASNALGAFFFVYTVAIILSYLFKEQEITGDMIMGAVCVYFLIGLMWASVFLILETLHPGSFQIPQELGQNLFDFVYYSFVTLTTLGYGDITPLTPPARSLSILAAAMGQLYIAVLVARLVGIHIAQSHR